MSPSATDHAATTPNEPDRAEALHRRRVVEFGEVIADYLAMDDRRRAAEGRLSSAA
jgi:hypothetical protein